MYIGTSGEIPPLSDSKGISRLPPRPCSGFARNDRGEACFNFYLSYRNIKSMNIKIRRVIMFGFIGLFIITAPILILYSAGYRYDLKKRSLIQTGSLFLEAKDLKKADIYLENQLYPKQLNEKLFIYNLLPGEYQIKLTKDGHYNWEKRLKINSNLTTFAKEIVLFRQTNPQKISQLDITDFQIDPYYQKIVTVIDQASNQEIYTINLNSQASELIYRSSGQNQINNIAWAPSGKKILIQKTNNKNLIINTENLKDIIDLNQISKISLTNINWDYFSDDTLWGYNQNTIYKISLSLKKAEKYFSPTNNDLIAPNFWVDNNTIYYFKIQKDSQDLYRHNLTLKTEEAIYSAQKNYNFSFIKSPDDYLTLLDTDKQKLIVINKTPLTPEISLNQKNFQEFNAKSAQWEFEEKNQLLYYNDFEVSIYYPKENKSYLVSRYGQPIKRATWYPNLNYILISFENQIKIVEIYIENGTRNIIDIVKDNTIHNFTLDEKGRYLYFSGQVNAESGLWQLEIN
jgi:hypothetical protein